MYVLESAGRLELIDYNLSYWRHIFRLRFIARKLPFLLPSLICIDNLVANKKSVD